MNRPRILAASGAAALALLAGPAVGRAQEGAGTTGAQVLQFALGGRAGALSGAYTAATGDADVLFYNPAGVADLRAAAALSYQRHVEDITLGTAAGALRTGPVVLGLAAAFLDAGVMQVQEPDPEYGGQRGRQTGATVGASETALRLAAGLPLLSGRLRVGAAAGIVALREMVERLPEDHVKARRLAEGLAAIRGIGIDPAAVQTNIVLFSVAALGVNSEEFLARLAGRGVLGTNFGKDTVRFVTHHDVEPAQIDGALRAVAEVVREIGGTMAP